MILFVNILMLVILVILVGFLTASTWNALVLWMVNHRRWSITDEDEKRKFLDAVQFKYGLFRP